MPFIPSKEKPTSGFIPLSEVLKEKEPEKKPSFLESLKGVGEKGIGYLKGFGETFGEPAGYKPLATFLARGVSKVEGLFKGTAFSQLKEAQKREAGLEAMKRERGMEALTEEEVKEQEEKVTRGLFEEYTPKQITASAGKVALDVHAIFNPAKLPLLDAGGWKSAFQYALRIAAPQELLRGEARREDVQPIEAAKDYAQGAAVSFIWDSATGVFMAGAKTISDKLVKTVTNFVKSSESKTKAFIESTKQKGWKETFKTVTTGFKDMVEDASEFIGSKDKEINILLKGNQSRTTIGELLDPIIEMRAKTAGTMAALQDVNIIKEELLKALSKADKSLKGLGLDDVLTVQQVNDFRKIVSSRLGDRDFARLLSELPDVKQSLKQITQSFSSYVKSAEKATIPIFEEMSSKLSYKDALNIAITKAEKGGTSMSLNRMIIPLLFGGGVGIGLKDPLVGVMAVGTILVLQEPQLAYKAGLLIKEVEGLVARELSSSEKEAINQLINSVLKKENE